VTHEDIVYDRRVRLLEHAAKINNVAEACRTFGVSRNTYYGWVAKAEQYGLSAALLPKERRKPHQPNAMTSEEVAVILAEASLDRHWVRSRCCGTSRLGA
jgi:transposase-like protein